jgi:HK97 family phage major capsid protein
MSTAAMDELSVEIKRIVGEFNTKASELSDAIAKSDEEIKAYGKVADDTKGLIAELSKRTEKAETQFEARLHAIEQLAQEGNSGKAAARTLGDLVVESEQLKAFARKQGVGEGGGQVRLSHKGMSDHVELKDITSSAPSAGAGIWSFRDPELVSDPYRPRMLRDLIPTVPVDSNLIEWVRTNVRTNNADAVSETGTKPKSDLTYQRVETPVRKLAHYFKTSAEVLADFARLRGEINTEGFEMLRQVEEDQLMAGDGTGVNLLGLIPQASPFDTALVESGDQQVDVIRRAILQVRKSYYSATGITLNPEDWAAIELLKDGESRYLFSTATNGAPPRLWGLPVSESDALPAGEFMVGAFRTAATIYDRMQAAVYISTENEDDFINNMVSILFEERLALAVKRPLAFVHGNLSGVS